MTQALGSAAKLLCCCVPEVEECPCKVTLEIQVQGYNGWFYNTNLNLGFTTPHCEVGQPSGGSMAWTRFERGDPVGIRAGSSITSSYTGTVAIFDHWVIHIDDQYPQGDPEEFYTTTERFHTIQPIDPTGARCSYWCTAVYLAPTFGYCATFARTNFHRLCGAATVRTMDIQPMGFHLNTNYSSEVFNLAYQTTEWGGPTDVSVSVQGEIAPAPCNPGENCECTCWAVMGGRVQGRPIVSAAPSCEGTVNGLFIQLDAASLSSLGGACPLYAYHQPSGFPGGCALPSMGATAGYVSHMACPDAAVVRTSPAVPPPPPPRAPGATKLPPVEPTRGRPPNASILARGEDDYLDQLGEGGRTRLARWAERRRSFNRTEAQVQASFEAWQRQREDPSNQPEPVEDPRIAQLVAARLALCEQCPRWMPAETNCRYLCDRGARCGGLFARTLRRAAHPAPDCPWNAIGRGAR